jgi:crossover junction endodeoxyribonuclease RuvC
MDNMRTTVLGLDLSFTATGWSIITVDENTIISYGEIETTKKSFPDDIDRCVEINKHIFDIISAYQPDVVIIENTFTGVNKATSKKLHQLGGIVRAMLKTAGVAYIDLAPTTLKKYVTNKGNASKQEMLDEINNVLGLELTSDNVADSLGLAMYGVREVHSASVTFNSIILDNE